MSMSLRRDEIRHELQKRFGASEHPSFATVRELIKHPERGLGFGEHGEGYECEGELEEGECVWEGEEEAGRETAKELDAMHAALEGVAPSSGLVAAAAEADDDLAASEWLRLLRRPTN